MSNEVNPHTTGDAPITSSGPTVTINGQEYTLRRLGIKDTFAVARIIAVGAAAAQQPLTNAEMSSPEKLQPLLLSGFIAAENTAVELLANLIGVSVKDFTNPDLFPMGSELQIIEALVEHQDLRAFFTLAGNLLRKLPEMQTRSPAA